MRYPSSAGVAFSSARWLAQKQRQSGIFERHVASKQGQRGHCEWQVAQKHIFPEQFLTANVFEAPPAQHFRTHVAQKQCLSSFCGRHVVLKQRQRGSFDRHADQKQRGGGFLNAMWLRSSATAALSSAKWPGIRAGGS